MEADVLIGDGVRYDERMGKRLGLVVIGALLLTGCASGEPETAPAPSATETAEAKVQSRSIEVSDAAPEPEATESESVDEEARYLDFVKRAWRTELPSDADLLAAAAIACDEMRAGKAAFELDLITGGSVENNSWHSSQVGAIASSTICPDAVPPL